MKILCVEDGSVDVEALENDELRDGKVLVYRSGARPPFVLEISEEYNYQKFWGILKNQMNIALENSSGHGRHYFENFIKTMELIEKGQLTHQHEDKGEQYGCKGKGQHQPKRT